MDIKGIFTDKIIMSKAALAIGLDIIAIVLAVKEQPMMIWITLLIISYAIMSSAANRMQQLYGDHSNNDL